MISKRWLLVSVLLCCTGIFAQKEEDAAKEKLRRQTMLIDSITADTRELRLGVNRAILFAKIGGRLWDIDQKRARDLFQDAVSELIGAQSAAESARKTGSQNVLLTGQSTRPQILQTIAARDAELALQSFYKTRPATIERAMYSVKAKDSRIRSNSGTEQYYLNNELQLEQSLLKLAADQNPERAITLLKAALKGGVSNETLHLLRKLYEKDPVAASEMAAEIVSQISRKTFIVANQPDYQTMQVASSILTESIRERPATEKSLRFDTSQMRPLAEKLISFYIERGSQYGYNLGPSILQIAEKYTPSMVEKLKNAEKIMPRRGLHYVNPDEATAKLLNNDTPVEQVLAEAAKLPAESRGRVYQSAATRLTAAGDFTRARSILNDNFSDEALENAVSTLDWYYAHQLMNQGRYPEAEALIDQFPESNKQSAMIALATAVFNKDAEKNKSYAGVLLEKARTQLSPRPETNTEMSQTMQVIGAYTKIEPPEAFRMFEGLVPQLNELTEAVVVMSGFQGNASIRQGEMLVEQSNSLGFYLDFVIVRNLAQIDFDRTMSIIASFARREMRVNLKLQLLEGL